jgi:hypothetical protein
VSNGVVACCLPRSDLGSSRIVCYGMNCVSVLIHSVFRSDDYWNGQIIDIVQNQNCSCLHLFHCTNDWCPTIDDVAHLNIASHEFLANLLNFSLF